MYRIAIITASDKGARGERVDVSGQVIREMCQEFATVTSYAVLADERAPLAAAMAAICDQDQADVIFTTGGTGFAPRDVTPEATLDVVERLAPGIPEAMRARSMQVTDRAMLTPGGGGHPQQHVDHQPAGQPQSGAGMPGGDPASPGTWDRNAPGQRRGMRPHLKEASNGNPYPCG